MRTLLKTEDPISFPAYDAIAKDIGLGYARWRVYMALQPPLLNFVTPQMVKVDALAGELGMGRQHVRKALRWLIESGYVVEYERGTRRVRVLTLAWAIPERSAPRAVVVATMTGAR